MELLKSVSTLKEKITARICSFTDDQLASKMMAMGALPGSTVEVVRIAPMGGGYYLKINGHNIAVRASEAASIVVE